MSEHETLRLYANAARRYDRLTGIMSFGSGPWYRRRVVASMNMPPGGTALDLGSGTGGVALAMQESMGNDARVIAMDTSAEMLREAKRCGVRETVEGSMNDIPLEDNSVDGVACGYAIRYATNLKKSLEEIRRVLKPGAPVVLMEMTIPESAIGRTMASLVVRRVSPLAMTVCCGSRGVGELMRHFWDSVAAFPPPSDVVALLEDIGFGRVRKHGPWGMLVEYRAYA